jgi:hypothetical protein
MGRQVRLDAIVPQVQTAFASGEFTSGAILAITYKQGKEQHRKWHESGIIALIPEPEEITIHSPIEPGIVPDAPVKAIDLSRGRLVPGQLLSGKIVQLEPGTISWVYNAREIPID